MSDPSKKARKQLKRDKGYLLRITMKPFRYRWAIAMGILKGK